MNEMRNGICLRPGTCLKNRKKKKPQLKIVHQFEKFRMFTLLPFYSEAIIANFSVVSLSPSETASKLSRLAPNHLSRRIIFTFFISVRTYLL